MNLINDDPDKRYGQVLRLTRHQVQASNVQIQWTATVVWLLLAYANRTAHGAMGVHQFGIAIIENIAILYIIWKWSGLGRDAHLLRWHRVLFAVVIGLIGTYFLFDARLGLVDGAATLGLVLFLSYTALVFAWLVLIVRPVKGR